MENQGTRWCFQEQGQGRDRQQLCAGQRTKSVAVDLLRMICVGPIGRSSEYIRRHITSVSRLIRHWVTEDGKDEKERGDGMVMINDQMIRWSDGQMIRL